MEADTKKQRGRPRVYGDMLYAIYRDKEKRTAQNLYYAGDAIMLMGQKPGDYFLTPRGNIRRQGIAEQIGRMHKQDGLPDDECKGICEQAISLTERGYSAKAVERMIRDMRKSIRG